MTESRKHGKPVNLPHFKLIDRGEMNPALSEDDVRRDVNGDRTSSLFLNRFTQARILRVLEEEKVLEGLEKQGFHSPLVWFTNPGPNEHRLTLSDGILPQGRFLGEIHLKTARFRPERGFVAGVDIGDQDFIFVEWLTMQNPLRDFTEERPRLPGQEYPGLGVARELVHVLVRVARVLDMDGIVNCPEYYHNAVLYQEVFKYYDPRFQGRVLAMKRDLGLSPLRVVSDAVDKGFLIDAVTGERMPWTTQEQILPLSGKTMRYFGADGYRDQAQSVFTSSRFKIDWDGYNAGR